VNRGAGSVGFTYRMVVIFGFGPGSPEDQGEVAPCVCPNCHNQVFLHHVRSKKSVRLYFVPVVPYGTDDYLVCPVCSRGLQVSSAQLRHVRPMSGATASFRAGRLPQARYMAQVAQFWRQLGVNPAGQQILAPASPGGPAPPPAGLSAGLAPPPSRAPPPPVAPPPPAPPPAPAADDEASWISRLQQLAELHDQGVLSDAAYAAAKQRILDHEQPQPPGPASPPTSPPTSPPASPPTSPSTSPSAS
jgi:Short C-terminal domain